MVKLELLTLDDFISTVKSYNSSLPVGVSFITESVEYWKVCKLVVTAYCPQHNVIFEYTHTEYTYISTPDEKQIKSVEQKKEDLMEKLRNSGFSVVHGIWKD